MERLAAKMGGTVKWPYNDSECLDAEFFKVKSIWTRKCIWDRYFFVFQIVADHLIKESGVRPILHCYAVEAIMDNDTIKGIITESKSGRRAILADRVIDCTGDADVAYLAGAEYRFVLKVKIQQFDFHFQSCFLYRMTTKAESMGMTQVFNCSGVNKAEFLEYTESNPATYKDWSRVWNQETAGKENDLRSPYLDLEFEKAREKEVIPKNAKNIGGSWSALRGETGEATNLNLAHVSGYSSVDVEDLTKAEMEGREQAMHALVALKAVVPGFAKARLRNFGMTIGTRDSRKIIGRHNLTAEEVKNQAEFPDSIGTFPEFIDGYNILILPTTGRYFQACILLLSKL